MKTREGKHGQAPRRGFMEHGGSGMLSMLKPWQGFIVVGYFRRLKGLSPNGAVVHIADP